MKGAAISDVGWDVPSSVAVLIAVAADTIAVREGAKKTDVSKA